MSKNVGIIEKIKRIFKRATILSTSTAEKIGYYNGLCPECHEHIGIDVFRDKVTTVKYAHCALCGREIYRQINQAEMVPI